MYSVQNRLSDQLESQDTRTLVETFTDYLLLLSSQERKSSSNSSNPFTEDAEKVRTLMAAYLLPGGGCLRYILERKAFTIPLAAQVTGIEPKIVYSVVMRLVRGGLAWERFRVGGQGRPATVYAMYDASDEQLCEAAALYKDQNAEHVKRLDDYVIMANEETYHRVAEEAVRGHVDHMGRVEFPAVVKLLSESGLYGEPHLHEMRQTLNVMGYSVIS